MFEKLAQFLACWHGKLKNWQAKLKHWHNVWHVGTSISTLACKNEKLARFRHVGMEACWARKPSWNESTLARRPRWHASMHGTRFSKLLQNLPIILSTDLSSMQTLKQLAPAHLYPLYKWLFLGNLVQTYH